jgi:hypothetical protein
MSGVTAAVRMLEVRCGGAAAHVEALVMPHSERRQPSTAVVFPARSGQRCTFALDEGFNMSYLSHYAKYTASEGGTGGQVNAADFGDLHIAVLQ